ncbi:GNAT family N-acetyltransferase [Agromyces mangrovi Wang et al. 2018]|uniref:GNAT family N-acetyltransferase n=1 Tax=Agromyces mangrovi TaxID=1858653 RepID=UPI0025730CD7|nr:GNAT family N-acetyltransferase [Agromyces mangrovi]BDZ64387.1 acetyltransferase ribosomal protein N-acetylase [Agromyces mangrovi]
MELELRPLEAADAETLASWAVDPVFCAHAGWRVRTSPDDAVLWWREAIAAPDPLLIRLLALHDGEAVGYVDLHGDADDARELGFLIGPSARWHRGLGTAAASAGLAHGFRVLGLARIWAEAVQANVHSVRVLRRVGMRETGAGGAEDFLGTSSRYRRFELTSAEWAERPAPQ